MRDFLLCSNQGGIKQGKETQLTKGIFKSIKGKKEFIKNFTEYKKLKDRERTI